MSRSFLTAAASLVAVFAAAGEKTATYVCSGSNFMSSGMCMREGTTPTSASVAK